MEQFVKKIEVRWSDLDPNFHMIHSRYYDLGAYCRLSFLVQNGMDPEFMKVNQIGPVLFREECIFKKEISFGDDVLINVKLQKATPDFSRWTMIHEIWKNESILAAIITCDGAWLNTDLRKLALPPAITKDIFDAMPKTDDFQFYIK